MYTGIEIFRTGEHTSSEGHRKTYTETDLDRIATYDRARHEAPVVIGHPASNAPAYGWVSRVYRDGETLKADLADLDPAFVGLIRSGRFKKRSISLYPDGTLRHVGFLGAVPPAVKGLKDVAFAEGDATTFDFDDSPPATILCRLRDWLTAQLGPDAPERDPLETRLDELSRSLTQLSERLTAKDERIASLTAALDATDTQHSQFAHFADEHITKLLPANRDRAIAVMTALAAAQPVRFAENGSDPTERNPLELFRELIRALPAQVSFGEHVTNATAAPAPEGLSARDLAGKIAAKRLAACAGGQRMSFAEAQGAVLREAAR